MKEHHRIPYLFDEFFASGKEESVSPFLTPRSRRWGRNLSLKSALFSFILLLFAYFFSFFNPSISDLCVIGVYFLAGTPALIASIEDLKNWELNIDVLMTLAALMSILIGSAKEGALLLVLFALSAALEHLVMDRTKGALLNLKQIAPKMAWVVTEHGTTVKAVQDIPIGTNLLIKAGELVPLDGRIIEGGSFVNLVYLTGESQPISKKCGDAVQAGAQLLEGSITVEVTRISSDSTLSRIIHLITSAQEAKPRIERFFDRFGKWYALSIILFSLFACLTLHLFFDLPMLGQEGALYRSLTFLIAASPCALILATPTAYLSAISSCAKRGILLKGGAILDAIARSDTIAFDKTGTLTTGKLLCKEVLHFDSEAICTQEEAVAIAAGLERHANHPIADALLRFAEEKRVSPVQIHNFISKPGFGLEGAIAFKEIMIQVAIGNPDFISSKIAPENAKMWELCKEHVHAIGELNTLLLVGNSLFAFHFYDEIRPAAYRSLSQLKRSNRIAILTGDHSLSARFVAKELGIEELHANLRPEEKLSKVAEMSQKTGLIMVGDGVNDAPALKRATVGISMGTIGSATAVDASDVVLLHDDLELIPFLKTKAQKTISIIKQNVLLALLVILFATTPALFGIVPLWIAVILHEGGTLLVGLNSLRLLR